MKYKISFYQKQSTALFRKQFKMDILEIKNLHAKTLDQSQKILKGINLKIKSGEIHAIMGPNGSGKSTLCKILMGHPKYKITRGEITFNGKNIKKLSTSERANLGLFLGFQHPLEIPGVSLGNFLRLSKNENAKANDKNTKNITPIEFIKILKQKAKNLKMDEKFISRYVNEGFSGGEKKRAEIMQMAILEPKIALLDEIDSGLDIDALKIVAKNINLIFKKNSPGILIITHYQRILNYITPDHVHIMKDGEIIKSGNKKLAEELEKTGYEKYIK